MIQKNRKNIRWATWDYRWDGAYFITICTHSKNYYFGNIYDGKMELSHLGILADVFWYEIKNHAKNIKLDAFVVMPNHIHGILILEGNDPEIKDRLSRENRFQNIGKNSISSILGSYKAAVTKHANRLGLEFGWQKRFHDHVIRDEKSLVRIQNYIINNPKKWHKDRFFQQ